MKKTVQVQLKSGRVKAPAHASHLGIRSAGMTYPLVILLVGPGKLHRPLVIENHFEFSFLVSN